MWLSNVTADSIRPGRRQGGFLMACLHCAVGRYGFTTTLVPMSTQLKRISAM